MHSVLMSDVTVNIAQACWVLSHVRKENKHTCGSNYIYPPTNVMIVHTLEVTNCMTHSKNFSPSLRMRCFVYGHVRVSFVLTV